jgi:cell division protein ZapA
MAQVTVSIGGHSYRLACDEGEEAHLESLAREVDAKFEGMHEAFGEIGDQRLMVIAEAERLAERERAARRDAEIQAVAAAQAFGELTQRVERLAAALSGPAKA